MAIPKKGSRKITVDGVDYRWTIRKKPTYSQALCQGNVLAAVELYDKPFSVLSINFPWVRYDNWFGIAEQPVTPKHIEQCIRRAIAKGWKPEINGNAFKIEHELESHT